MPTAIPRRLCAGAVIVLVALGALASTLLPGCDNPACAFGGTCAGGSGGGAIGSEPATIPQNGETIEGPVPRVVEVFPDGLDADSKTPVVVRFSESMASTNMNLAFQLIRDGFSIIPFQGSALVGDGHLLVLFPIAELTPGASYTVMYREGVKIADRTGQAVLPPADLVATTFTVAEMDASAPAVLATWPVDGFTSQSPTTEIVAVFTRPLDAVTVNSGSWVVTVDGAAPMFDASPQVLTVAGLVSVTSVYRWRSLTPQGGFASLGTGADVELTLSPTGNTIEDTGGDPLPTTTIGFATAAFSAPMAAFLLSEPSDAIGIANVSGPSTLSIQVDFEDAASGDRVAIFVFGTDPVVAENPPLIALVREVPLPDPFNTVVLTAADLDLATGSSPPHGVFADGPITFAFQVRRGSLTSPVTLLDVDLVKTGVQGPLFDLTAPTLVALSATGMSTTAMRSDLRDLVVVGRASELLRAALVSTTSAGDNEIVDGTPPPVAGAHASGLFVAAPVHVGLLAGTQNPIPFDLTLYDRALNPSTPTSAMLTQVGAASGGLPPPFGDLAIDVFDSATLAPISGVEVQVHEDAGGGYAFVMDGMTDATGHVTLPGALIGDTIVTVVKSGYGLFTFDGLPTDRLSVPLTLTSASTVNATGQVATVDPTFAIYTRNVADVRVAQIGETLASVNACAFDAMDQRFECPFGPVPITTGKLGAETAFSSLPVTNPLIFVAQAFLKSFALALPLPPATTTSQTTTLVLDPSLDSPALDDEEHAIEAQGLIFTNAGITASSDPRVRVEAISPGISTPLTVGLGQAFDDGQPPDTWLVRSAIPGAFDPEADTMPGDLVGRYVRDGVVEGDLFLRCEAVDASGNRGGRRPRFSSAPLAVAATLPSTIASTAPDAGGANMEVTCTDVLPDALGEAGIYRLVISDATGRTWTIWKLDAPDASGPNFVFRAPYVRGTFPLDNASAMARVSAFAWQGFDPASFLWTDVEREFDAFSHAVSVVITPP